MTPGTSRLWIAGMVAALIGGCGGGANEAVKPAGERGAIQRPMGGTDDGAAAAPSLYAKWDLLPNPDYAPPTGPYVRVWTEMTWDSSRKEIVVFGGNGYHSYENDIWSYNGATSKWTLIDPYVYCPGNTGFTKPNGTDDSAFKYDPVNNLYWVFGAASGYRCKSYTASYTAGTGTTPSAIVDLSLPSSVPDEYKGWRVSVGDVDVEIDGYDAAAHRLALKSPIAALAPGRTYLLYATTGAGVWYYDPSTAAWTGQNTPPGNTGPTPTLSRIAPAVDFSSADEAFALFGGFNNGADHRVWRLDVRTKQWTALPVPAGAKPPHMRELLNSFVYDPDNDVFILFGGACSYDPVCPDYTLNGQTWAYHLPTNTWTNMNPAVSPAARAQHVMAYDREHGVVVLFGGVTGPGQFASDTWIYHYPSNTWQQLTPSVSPQARYLAQIAYDPDQKRTVVFGGQGSTGARADIWGLKLSAQPPTNASPTVALSSPVAGATYTAPASVTLAASAADSDGSIARVEFYAGATKIGERTAAPYTLAWSNVAAGSYSLTAVATDNQGARTTSAAVGITVNAAANVAPTVALTAPASGASYTAPASVTIAANAVDSDGSIAKVEFYAGATKIGEATSAPYQITWTGVGAGSYSLSARATDNQGAGTTSAAVGITVNAAANVAPTVALTAPASGASYTAPASITLSANASDSDGSIAKVEFYAGTTKIGERTAAPYTLVWSNVAAGSYSLTAVATDNQGAGTTSAAVGISVSAAGGGGAVNVALASNGAVALASAQYSPNHPASAVIDGVRHGKDLGKGGVWADNSFNRYPDWVQVSFNGAKTIERIDVITLPDDILAGTDPTPEKTFTLYGITDFEVQYWTGSGWAAIPGGTVTGNNRVWRSFSFAPLTTTSVRVVVNGASSYGLSFLTEIEAWALP